MIRALVIYCHPNPGSFTAAVRDVVMERLEHANADCRLVDLHAVDFNPVMGWHEHGRYLDTERNRSGLEPSLRDLEWCNTLIFVYPTWWYGLPSMLKGWLDRVLIPGIAFHMPGEDARTIRPGLTNVTRLAVYTTCGASWFMTLLIGAPGKRTILRGVRTICAPRLRTSFAAHYLMDSSTDTSRKRHLAKVSGKVDRLLA